MPKFIFLSALLLLSAGCAALQPSAPTPIIIVVTATPDASAQNNTSAPTPIASPIAGTPIPETSSTAPTAQPPATSRSGFPMKPTTVQSVRAKVDLNIRKGPGTTYEIVGGLFNSKTVQVTGLSEDEQWWRVLCPDGSNGECWVTADPLATEPVGTAFTPVPVTVDPNVQPPPTARTGFPMKATDIKAVRAKINLNLRRGPGTIYEIAGGIYQGQTAQVTGLSEDGQWWRVQCPDGDTGECWVTADPLATEPTNANPGATTSASPADSETFVRALSAALQGKNIDALKSMMADPFTIANWLSEGTQPSRDQALLVMKNWVTPASNIVIDVAGKTDQTKLLNGTNPLSMWDPNAKVVQSVYVKGLGETGKDEALLIIAQREDKSLYWYGVLYANGGFSK